MANDKDIESLIGEWLAKVPNVMCYTERMKIYAPTCYGECEPEVQKLVERVNELFGGSTTYDQCTGCWFDEEIKKVECEPIKVIEVAHNCSKKEDLKQLMDAIVDYATKTDQKTLSIQNGKFYIAKKPQLIEKYEALTKEVPA